MAISITKPTIGASQDTWGNLLNSGLDTIVGQVNTNDANIAQLQADVAAINTFPSGGIVMWSGTIANIPAGWYLCNGANGTPNLTDKFIMGVAADADINTTGGATNKTLTAANIPAHSHTFSGTTNTTGNHYHLDGEVMDVSSEATYGYTASTSASRVDQSQSETKNLHAHTSTAGNHSHTFSGTTSSYGSGTAFDNRPDYYALAFIMKA